MYKARENRPKPVRQRLDGLKSVIDTPNRPNRQGKKRLYEKIKEKNHEKICVCMYVCMRVYIRIRVYIYGVGKR